MINLNHLRIFYYAVKYQNFTQAARRLCITQPAVTAQIKAFEDQLKLKLFKKRGRKIYSTTESELLYEYARKVFETEEAFEAAVAALHGLKKGILRLGAAKTYARYLLPSLISKFLQDYPDIQIKVAEGSSRDLIGSLLEFENDLAIIVKTEDVREIRFIPFFRTELVLIMAPKHRLVRQAKVCIADLCREKIIMKEPGSATRKLVDDLFDRHRSRPDVLMETSNSEFIKQLVEQGKGISFLSRESVRAELSERRLATKPITDGQIYMEANIACLSHHSPSLVVRAFLDYLEKISPPGRSPLEISDLKEKIVTDNAALKSA